MPFKRLAELKAPGLICLVLLITVSGSMTLRCEEPDYRKIFGNDWSKAEEFVRGNEAWMKRLSEITGISYTEAVSVVFPELIRYSALRDRIEVSLLQALYINLGEEYADFSTGYFQMKPSFAESVHSNSHFLRGRLRNHFRNRTEENNTGEYRRTIVDDMQKPWMQFIYLAAFIRICEARFDLSDLNSEQRIRFLSTAYNYSFQKSYEQILAMAGKRFFTTGTGNGEKYPYSDISLCWFRSCGETMNGTVKP